MWGKQGLFRTESGRFGTIFPDWQSGNGSWLANLPPFYSKWIASPIVSGFCSAFGLVAFEGGMQAICPIAVFRCCMSDPSAPSLPAQYGQRGRPLFVARSWAGSRSSCSNKLIQRSDMRPKFIKRSKAQEGLFGLSRPNRAAITEIGLSRRSLKLSAARRNWNIRVRRTSEP